MHYVCQNCKKARAAVHITEVPEKREQHLCDGCAEKEGGVVKQHQTTSAMLQEFFKHKVGPGHAGDTSCPKCGITFREFQATGQLGCAHDYVAFRSLLTPLLERAHENAAHHVGKVPATADINLQRQSELIRFRRELQAAVREENYELAARLRDQIRALQGSQPSESP